MFLVFSHRLVTFPIVSEDEGRTSSNSEGETKYVMSPNLVLYDENSLSSWRHGSISRLMHFLAQIYAVSYTYQRFQPFWNYSKAFHELQCQHCGYIIDIWVISGHYQVFPHETNWGVPSKLSSCASGNFASSDQKWPQIYFLPHNMARGSQSDQHAWVLLSWYGRVIEYKWKRLFDPGDPKWPQIFPITLIKGRKAKMYSLPQNKF